jgi:hypothetical protein
MTTTIVIRQNVGVTVTRDAAAVTVQPRTVTIRLARRGPQGPPGPGGGGGSSWVVDYFGAFGPFYDVAVPAGVFGPLAWGPDFFLYQTPSGEYLTAQAAAVETIGCADYRDALGNSVPANERIWTLTGGVWLIDVVQPQPGQPIVLADWTAFGQWALGVTMILTGDGRMEEINLQHDRAAFAHTTGLVFAAANGYDGDLGGVPVGTVFVDATAGPVVRTLDATPYPGREVVYVKTDGTANTVSVAPSPGQSILGPADPVVLTAAWQVARLVFDGTDWVTVTTAGPAGPAGPPGTAATITVGTTTTLTAGDPATVANSGTSSAAVFDFGIPEGPQGDKGDPGDPGAPGAAATVDAGTTTTLAAGSPATVTNSGSTSAAVFDFGIPEGPQGDPGDPGAPGTAATIAAGTATAVPYGDPPTVTNSGTSSAAIFDFEIPQGEQGDPGPPGPGVDVSDATKEPIGHTDKTESVISFDNGSRTFTIAPVGSTYEVWCAGTKYDLTTQSVTIPNTTGLYYLSFTAGVLGYSTTYFVWNVQTPTAYVYWNQSTGKAEFFADERHGVTLDWATHEYLHRTRGAAFATGFSLSGYTLSGTGANDADAEMALSGGTFFDEDLQVDVVSSATPTPNTWEQNLALPMQVPTFYLSGTAWRADAATNFPLKTGVQRAQYNVLSGGSWTTADAGNSDYVISWLAATNNLTNPVLTILGQASYTSLPAARNASWDSLVLTNFPVFEFRPLYKLIFQTRTSYANTPHSRLADIQDLRGGASVGSGSVVSDHGLLNGLADDDHVQYALADGSRGSFAALTHALTHASAGSDPVALDTTQVTSGVFTSARLARPIGATGSQLSGGATGGQALVPTASSAATQSVALGSLLLAQTDRSGLVNVLGVWVTATSLTAGQSVLIAAYNASATTGLPTTLAWSQAVTVGTTTNFVAQTGLSLTVPAGAWIGIQNPSTNAGTVTFTGAQPTIGGLFLGGLSRFCLAASSQGATAALDVSAYTYSTSGGATTFGTQQTAPQIIGRLT